MPTGMTKAQANVVARYNALLAGADLTLVELTKDGSNGVRFGVEDNKGTLIAIVLSKDDPEEDYNVSDLGTNSADE